MNEYNVFADILNKYSQLTPWVQALLGVGFFAVVLCVAYFFKEMVANVVQPFRRDTAAKPKREWRDKYYRGEEAQ